MFNKKGFTLVEVILTTIIVATVVILSLGHILLITQRYWVEGGREVELQRDLSLSMDWMKRVLREGERVTISAGGESIEVENPWGERKRFYREGNNLRVETAGVSRVIVDNLMSLSFFWGIRAIGIEISLSEHDLEISARSAAILRNRPLAAEWLSDENTGLTLRDTSPNRNEGTRHGATWTHGKHGSALSFDGINDYVRVSDDVTLNLTERISVEAWVKLQNTGNPHPIIGKGEREGFWWWSRYYGYGLAVGEYGHLGAILGAGRGDYYKEHSTGYIKWDVWQAIGFTYYNGELRLYINGVLDRVVAVGAIFLSSDQDLYIGGYPGEPRYWAQGKIDEVRIAY